MNKKVGIAGCGALGSIVAQALTDGLEGYELAAISDVEKRPFNVPALNFSELAETCDIIVECLPAAIVQELADEVLSRGKTLIAISSSALMIYPDILRKAKMSSGHLIIPSGALCGLDAVTALSWPGIDSAKIVSTKPPRGFKGAPYVVQNNIDVDHMTEKTLIFSGNALDAAKAFPANVNVAATLSLAGLGPEKTMVEVWADPKAFGNSHEIIVEGGGSLLRSRIENRPDPSNPKSSMLAAWSIISTLKKLNQTITVM